MIYRGPGLLVVERFGSSPTPYRRHTGRQLLTVEGGRRGATSYDGEKAWSSIKHSVLSGLGKYGVDYIKSRVSGRVVNVITNTRNYA